MNLKEHLLSRGMQPDRPGLLLDEESNRATFLLYNLSGQIVGYHQYFPEGTKQIRNEEHRRDELKYFTFVGDEGGDLGRKAGKKKLAVWGIETVKQEHDTVFIAEGIFDAVKLQNLGLAAIAALANDPYPIRPFLKALSKRVVSICDRDDAGRRLASLADLAFSVPEPYHDLGDMPQDAVESFLKDKGLL